MRQLVSPRFFHIEGNCIREKAIEFLRRATFRVQTIQLVLIHLFEELPESRFEPTLAALEAIFVLALVPTRD